MQKLIETYRKVPSPSNRLKLQAYINKHIMAMCLLSSTDTEFLRIHGFSI